MIGSLNAALEGRYAIERELGEGGMATVYLARDERHDRYVAIKVLKSELAAVVGAERFLSEIKTTANLQHPHILPLYDSGEADGMLWYAMPYLEGESLRDRLDREKQLPIDDAVAIAAKVAHALDSAHEQGVVHRDVKPANILLSDRGEPLVADFGIALAVTQAGGGRLTQTGLSMGTPHYMSPEQASGDADVDPRSDVYALGCVLFELLAGEPPFPGPTAQAVLARILTDEAPAITTKRRTVPANVGAAIARATERLPADRFASAREFAEALTDPTFTHSVGGALVGEGGGAWRRRFFGAAGVAVLSLATAAWFATRGSGETTTPEPVRFAERLPFLALPGSVHLDVSPDGRRIAIANSAEYSVFLRDLDDSEMRRVDDIGEHVRFSADGLWLAGNRGPENFGLVPLQGGTPLTLGSAGGPLAFGADGFVYFRIAGGEGIARILQTGGGVDTLIVPGEGSFTHSPQITVPGGGGLLLSRFDADERAVSVLALDLESRETERLFATSHPRSLAYAGGGVLLHADGRFLMAIPFDPVEMSVTGDPVPVVEGEARGQLTFGYGGGTLVYTVSSPESGDRLVIRNRRGDTRALPNLPGGRYLRPDVSPDGERIAVRRMQADGQSMDVWSYQLPEGPLTRVSLSDYGDYPRWTPDGRYLLFQQSGDVYRRAADGTDDPVLIFDGEYAVSRAVPHPDGDRLFVQERPGAWDIRLVHLSDRSRDSMFLETPVWEGHPEVSPDGRWLAYYSEESGNTEIYVRSLQGEPARYQISRNGGNNPRWGSNGTELFFTEQVSGRQTLMAAALDIGPDGITVESIESLFETRGSAFAPFPEGDSLFAVIDATPGAELDESRLNVVLNFDAVLRALPFWNDRLP